ncbi:VCBS repeat-containing protein [Ensifer sp. ENS06]|uniref:FG-GAP-like repeat-containing protein n=1 Tax=Ensifer sp. ENS06 TaxID=2769276 RepID=UPI00177EEFCC|nr:FG-GAP-like repeat-containing protein [Ensifer sp. ENS06]MBD9628007.1 VCBS repeat-containing protein [Ensifer sp. ENS06]
MRHLRKLLHLSLALTLAISGMGPVRAQPAATSDSDDEVGSDKGRFAVTASGSANYTIKLHVPPGIQGYEPALSFNYNSTSQNGLLGIGWNLSGFSKISRVSQILAIDKTAGSLSFTNNDRFALNGRRLLVMNGDYGAANSTYRAELDNWELVAASGQSGNGPQSFTVKQPDGEILVFGGTPDSRVLVPGADTVREWLLSSQTDRDGNQISFTYSLDPLNTGKVGAQAYPVQISYGGNLKAGRQADRFVRMIYEARPDVLRAFSAGAKIVTTLRLAGATTYLAADAVAIYKLSYDTSASTGGSRVSAIQRLSPSDQSAKTLAGSKFTYQEGANAFAGAETWLQGAFTPDTGWDPHNNPVELADVNGDGLVDIVGFKNGVQVALGKAGGYSAPQTWLNYFSPEYDWSADEPRYLVDVNGDGLADIVGFSQKGVELALANAETSSFIKSANTLSYFSPDTGWQSAAPRYLADVNGDGAADIVGFNNGVEVSLAAASGGFAPPERWFDDFGVEQGWSGDNLLLADMNGDGKSDVVAMNQQTRSVNVALSTGSSFTETGWNQDYANFADSTRWSADTPRMVSDVNGDGLSDIIGFGTTVMVGLSNGAGFEAPEEWSQSFNAPNWSKSTPRMFTDVNGDGQADVVGVNDGGVEIALSTGSAFAAGNWNQNSLNGLGLSEGGTIDQTKRMIVDVNGDGMLDVIAFTHDGVKVGLTSGAFPDLLNKIERPSRGTINISYKPISDPTVYDPKVYKESAGPGALAKFQSFRPLQQNPSLPNYRSRSHLTGRFYVVAAITNANNPAISQTPYSYTTSHSYQNGQVSNTGRGFLGFERAVHVNEDLGRRTILTYHQEFPLIGRLKTREIGCSASVAGACEANDRLKEENFSYLVTSPAKSETNGLETKMVRPSFVRTDRYQGQTYTHSIGTSYAYDTYGNRLMTARLNLVDQLGRDLDANDSIYIHSAYQNDADDWLFGFRTFKKVSHSPTIVDAEKFDPSTDMELKAWTYGENMRVTASKVWDDQAKNFLATQYAYDTLGNRASITLPGGATIQQKYEARFGTYLESRTKSVGQGKPALVSKFGYDARFGKLSLRVDANGNQFATCYDDFGRRQVVQGPAPEDADPSILTAPCVGAYITVPGDVTPTKLATLTSFTHGWQNGVPVVSRKSVASWPSANQPQKMQTTLYAYDGLERQYRMSAQSDEGGPTDRVMKDVTYDSANRIVRSALPYFEAEEPLFYQNTMFDPLDRVIESSMPWQSDDGVINVATKQVYTETDTGDRVAQTLAAGTSYEAQRVFDRSYYNNRKKIEVQSFTDEPEANSTPVVTRYDLDALGRITAVRPPKDGGSTAAQYTYDSIGRLSQSTLPAYGKTVFEYGPDGRLSKKIVPNGEISFERDDLGRTLNAAYPGGPDIAYTYDDKFIANGLGRMASASVEGQTVSVKRSYVYDAYGRQAANALTIGTDEAMVQTTVFDPLGRATATTMPDGTVLTTGYDLERVASYSINGTQKIGFGDYTALGLPQTMKFANGLTTSLTYAPNFTLLGVKTSTPQQTVFQESSTVDPFGFTTAVTGSSSKWPSYSKASSFTDARLTNYQDSRLGAANAYGYDAAGNLQSSAALALQSTGFQLGADSKLSGEPLQAQYDPSGNLITTSAPSLTFRGEYDGRQRMSQAAKGNGAAAQFAYDHRGFRVWRKDTGGVEHRYHSGQFHRSAGVDQTLIFGNTGPSYIFSSENGAETFLHSDARNSLAMTTDAKGNAVDWFLYDAYGLPVARGVDAPDFGFLGLPYDRDTGLYYVDQRYYMPELARFTRADSRYGASIYRHDSANRYAFLLNNPTFGFDPTGHGLPACLIGLGGGVIGTLGGSLSTVDAVEQKNRLLITASAAGIVGGLFSGAGGVSACIKLYRQRAAGDNDQTDNGNGGGDDNGQGMDIDDSSNGSGVGGGQGGNASSSSTSSSSSASSDSGSESDDEGSESSSSEDDVQFPDGQNNVVDGSSSSEESVDDIVVGDSQSATDSISGEGLAATTSQSVEIGQTSGSGIEATSIASSSASGTSDAATSTTSAAITATEGNAAGLDASSSVGVSVGTEVTESAATVATEAVVTPAAEASEIFLADFAFFLALL